MAPRPDEDPLTIALTPPWDESPTQREARERAELGAKKVSEEIDEQIRLERAALKKKKRPVKVLLLGQSESGKSATLKNFQMTYARQEWQEERASWRAVIQLNLVRNINSLLDIVTEEMSLKSEFGSSASSSTTPQPHRRASLSATPFTEKHRLLKLRLGPLRRIQKDLERRLGAATIEVQSTTVTTAAPFSSSYQKAMLQEFSINSSNGWKTALDRFRSLRPSPSVPKRGWDAELEEITEVIASCAEDMKAIWEDPTVRSILDKRKERLDETPGFFLDDVERIASRTYQPSDPDVVRARLRTLGVQEYKFIFDHGRRIGQEWHMYDVGGTRSSRHAWMPYFDDVDAIIFLAPISCFDEKLAEDRTVNRLEDSYLLWKAICKCKLLSKTQVILFLNKCDILEAKLKRGVRIKDSVPSFGDRSNDVATATKYFQQHFKEIFRQYSHSARPFHVHLTSVIDTRATADTLSDVEANILKDHLKRAELI